MTRRAERPERLAAAGRIALALVLACASASSPAFPRPAAAGEAADKASGTPVMVAQAGSSCFSDTVRATGFLAPRTEAVVALTLDGYQVTEVLAADDDLVARGQALAKLSRLGPAPSARTGLASSITLRAPAAGRIVQAAATVGAVSSPRGDPLFRLAIDGVIEVEAEVSSIYLSEIKPGQSARVEIAPSQEAGGRVRAIGAQIDPATQMGHVRIALDGEAARRPGRFVRATIEARQSCGVAVPRSAVRYTAEGASVQVVRGGRIETLPVKVGLRSGREAEIREGLRAGELVVAQAGGSLGDGDAVAPVLSGDPAPAQERR